MADWNTVPSTPSPSAPLPGQAPLPVVADFSKPSAPAATPAAPKPDTATPTSASVPAASTAETAPGKAPVAEDKPDPDEDAGKNEGSAKERRSQAQMLEVRSAGLARKLSFRYLELADYYAAQAKALLEQRTASNTNYIDAEVEALVEFSTKYMRASAAAGEFTNALAGDRA